MAHRRRNEDVDGGDRLQGKRVHLKADVSESRLHGVDDLARQEGGDDGRSGGLAALTNEALQGDVVERVLDRAVADAVVAAGVFDVLGIGEFRLRCLHAREVEGALLLVGDDAVDLDGGFGGHGVEGAAGSCDGGGLQRACRLFQLALDLADEVGDLRHVVNLAVEHGARLVLAAHGREDAHLLVVEFFSDDADDAACADVEREDRLAVRLLLRSCSRGLGSSLFDGALRRLLGGSFRALGARAPRRRLGGGLPAALFGGGFCRITGGFICSAVRFVLCGDCCRIVCTGSGLFARLCRIRRGGCSGLRPRSFRFAWRNSLA